jgi:Ca2+/Na+ antiporter
VPDQTLSEAARQQRFAVAMLVVVVVLAGVNWILSPAQAQRWLGAMLTLPALCAGLALWYVWVRRSSRSADADNAQAKRYFMSAVTLILLAVGIPQIVQFGLEIWAKTGNPSADLEVERRLLGLAAGVVFVVIGNRLPKILTPLSILPLPLAERVTRARRFIGTVWVILGLAMMAGFLAVPLASARTLARWAAVTGLLTVLGAVVWMNSGAGGREEP